MSEIDCIRNITWEEEINMKSFVGQPIQIDRNRIFINPGTGPVFGATAQNAAKNIAGLLCDVGIDVKVVRVSEWDHEGLFGFELQHEGHTCQVDMPGLELKQVRYVDREMQDIWDFPRLYVDGSSWVWKFAVDIVRETLNEEKEL